jgi:hypothetical protein
MEIAGRGSAGNGNSSVGMMRSNSPLNRKGITATTSVNFRAKLSTDDD